MGSMGYAGALLVVWFALGILGVGLAVWLLQRTWKRRKTRSPSMTVMAVVIAGAVFLGAFGTLLGLVRAFGAVGVENVDPSQKANMLAEGISEAMNCTALGFAVGVPGTVLAWVMARFRKGPE